MPLSENLYFDSDIETKSFKEIKEEISLYDMKFINTILPKIYI